MKDMAEDKNRRRIILADHRVQWAIARHTVLYWLAFTLTTLAVLALHLLFLGLFTPWREHWPAICRLVAVAMSLSLILILPLFIYKSFQLSNRFVGPVKRLRRTLRELAEGKPFSPVKFRKDDYWQEMAEELNLAIETLMKQRSAEEPAASDDNENRQLQDLETVAS